jgi:hypothetical protein
MHAAGVGGGYRREHARRRGHVGDRMMPPRRDPSAGRDLVATLLVIALLLSGCRSDPTVHRGPDFTLPHADDAKISIVNFWNGEECTTMYDVGRTFLSITIRPLDHLVDTDAERRFLFNDAIERVCGALPHASSDGTVTLLEAAKVIKVATMNGEDVVIDSRHPFQPENRQLLRVLIGGRFVATFLVTPSGASMGPDEMAAFLDSMEVRDL